jgi:hypothetical protein
MKYILHVSFLIQANLLCPSSLWASSSSVIHRASETELRNFLGKLAKVGEHEELKEFKASGASTFASGLHSLWLADVNNDGKLDYFWTSEAEGSSRNDSFQVYSEGPQGSITEQSFPLDGPEWPTNLQNPPLKMLGNQTAIRFQNVYCMTSKDKSASAVVVCSDNRAKFIVRENSDYLWKSRTGNFRNRKNESTRLKE